ncbi:hypothetical protein HF1_10330 [Mycoplasma haemofelis str. Langford 1]|uniref:Uncharacterized protein n=1 Tax=Mycoplasma haemofelis (strain Langford 1) TaxID=941640 RepID=E8ZIS0_MYCHL|nr:hypothetical protein [Mycoplasma haemofelis]CBY93041.1 hypothetical protein HF1_10330 [Mycoplasma haemofelis str. Langford 1]
MRPIPTIALLGLGTAGLGSWYKFHHLQPKTLRQYLEWQGLRLISDSESNYWKAAVEENKELVKKLNLDESKLEGVKEWCRNHLDLEKYEDVKDSALLLCVDNPKSVKARIIQLDGGTDRLIHGSESDKQYKVAYVFRKHIDGFNALIGYVPTKNEKGEEQIDLAQAKEAFQKWCESSLNRPVEDTLVLNIRELCTPKEFSKVEDYLKGKTLLTKEGKDSTLDAVYKKIKDFASYKADITKENKEGLKEWCEENLKKEFSESLSIFEETLPKVISRCVEGSEASEK